MLIAKPRGQGQAPYDMPSILDFTEFGDVDAYRDHAKRAAHSLLRVGDVKSQEISVAVHNFEDSAIQSVGSYSLDQNQQFSFKLFGFPWWQRGLLQLHFHRKRAFL